MNPKRTMTLNLTDQEMRVLEELSTQKDLSKTAILRQALAKWPDGVEIVVRFRRDPASAADRATSLHFSHEAGASRP